MSRHPASDLGKVLLSLAAGPLALVFLVLCVVFSLGRCSKPDGTVSALRDTVRIADTVEVVKRDTIVRYQRRVDTVHAASDSLDSLVVIRDDSTLIVPDTVIVVPPVVVANLNALRLTVSVQDTLIRHLYQHDTTQQWRIESRDRLIRELSKRKPCSLKCGVVLGFTAGIVLHKLVK